MPIGSARVRSTASVCGSVSASTTNRFDFDLAVRRISVIASAAAVRLVEHRGVGDVQAR